MQFHVRFVVERVALQQVFLWVLSVFYVTHNSATAPYYVYNSPDVYDNSDQAAFYYILSLEHFMPWIRHLVICKLRKWTYFYMWVNGLWLVEVKQWKMWEIGQVLLCYNTVMSHTCDCSGDTKIIAVRTSSICKISRHSIHPEQQYYVCICGQTQQGYIGDSGDKEH